ncbi:MAG: FAD-dependent oxidoreductase [Clostridia bacterium]|nr:FAD-dependent oxidoreductase [Clostridia bacterium]
MESIWIRNSEPLHADQTLKKTKTDILVIGGGITGILCGYFLKKAGVDCLILEAETICGGVTRNTTAKLTAQHGLIYDSMIRRFGVETAKGYWQVQQKALEEYRRLSETISCDLEEKNNVVYSLDDRRKIEKEVKALQRIGVPAAFEEQLPLPFSVAGAVSVPRQGQFHPLKLLYELAKELPLAEHTRVLEFRPGEVITNRGRVEAKRIIVATHFPLFNRHGMYFLKLYQHRSYVLALEQAPDLPGMYVDEAKKGLSFRNAEGLLLLGGGSHRTGKKGGNWEELRVFAERHFPEAREVTHWATQDCMTLDELPYIGAYSPRTPNLYVATGFNKWGMTSAMVSAMILSDLVQDKPNDYSELFSPSRSIWHPQLAMNGAEALVDLLTPTVPRCPHLGCALHYNPQEHSWDCACHGSRFTKEGRVLNNPANGSKKMK